MDERVLFERTRDLRSAGCTPKQVAKLLGVSSGEAARLVRLVACENELSAPEPAVVGCWLSPGCAHGHPMLRPRRHGTEPFHHHCVRPPEYVALHEHT